MIGPRPATVASYAALWLSTARPVTVRVLLNTTIIVDDELIVKVDVMQATIRCWYRRSIC